MTPGQGHPGRHGKINIKIVDFGGLPADVLGNLVNFNIGIPKLPAGVKIQKHQHHPAGLRITATGITPPEPVTE